jgi:hypothetical protein
VPAATAVPRTWRTSRSPGLPTGPCLLAGDAVDTGRPGPVRGFRPMCIDHPCSHLSPAVRQLHEHSVLLPLAALLGPRFESYVDTPAAQQYLRNAPRRLVSEGRITLGISLWLLRASFRQPNRL